MVSRTGWRVVKRAHLKSVFVDTVESREGVSFEGWFVGHGGES